MKPLVGGAWGKGNGGATLRQGNKIDNGHLYNGNGVPVTFALDKINATIRLSSASVRKETNVTRKL